MKNFFFYSVLRLLKIAFKEVLTCDLNGQHEAIGDTLVYNLRCTHRLTVIDIKCRLSIDIIDIIPQ